MFRDVFFECSEIVGGANPGYSNTKLKSIILKKNVELPETDVVSLRDASSESTMKNP